MKTNSNILILSACVILTIPAFAEYDISWHSIDAGGGRSAGGDFALTGTIGQPDAGRLPARYGLERIFLNQSPG